MPAEGADDAPITIYLLALPDQQGFLLCRKQENNR
jgi:hypothetical protein